MKKDGTPARAPGGLYDVDELAALFRVTAKTIRDWRLQGMPAAKEGGKGRGNRALFDLEDCVAWYFEENFERLELDRQRTRLASEQAQKLAIENAVRAGAVGEFDIWQAELEQLLGEIRATLLAFPSKEAPRLDGDTNQRKDRLDEAIAEVLRKLANFKPSRAGARGSSSSNAGGGAGADTSAEADGLAMGGQISATVARKQRRAGGVAH